MNTWFPDMDQTTLERVAREHAYALEVYDGDPDRLAVNYLRHECTDYDYHQTQGQHRAACEAIGKRYPWLAAEAARQVAARAESERRDREAMAMLARQEEEEAEARRAMIVESREIIGGFAVGQRVGVKIKGHDRVGTVTKVGRSKVTVSYQIATGKNRDRVAIIHAALLKVLA